jgi:EF hand domain-containing protein
MAMIKVISIASLLLLSGPALAADPDAKSTTPTREVMRYDTNKDGWVDKAEWTAGQEARFKELDTNKDGKLSQDELFARAPAAPGNVLPTDRQFERQSVFFQRMDTDKDGFVSKAEFMAQADRNFARCDLDKDGRVNTAECRQALRRPSSTPVRSDR